MSAKESKLAQKQDELKSSINHIVSHSSDKDPLIIIASNRGPYSFKALKNGTFETKRGAGGLVTALGALAETHDVLWVASAISRDDYQWAEAHPNPVNLDGISLKLIQADKNAYKKYYNVISNPLLWFIQHEMWDNIRNPSMTRETWDAWNHGYVPVNQLFATAIAEIIAHTDRPVIVFPQDYHLYLMPQFLREKVGWKVQIQPFLHIPWPSPDAWRVLPAQMREQILVSMMQSDRIGFQTKRDAFNFVQTARFYAPDAHSHGSRNSIHYQGRRVATTDYPISIDTEKLQELVETDEVKVFRQQIRDYVVDRQLILRTDRIEPSKNILRGLQAYRTLLEDYPKHRGKVTMMALLVPSRMGVDEYQTYLKDIVSEAGFINAEYSDGLWEPVRILIGDNYFRALAAMQEYDVLLINPIADGMNLVAKEGALVNESDGVLVLSEHAGAFYELGDHALTVSPYDVYGTALALHKALTMPQDQRHKEAQALKQIVTKSDVKQWFADQLNDALRALNSQ